MEELIISPFFSLDNLYSHYPPLSYPAVNRYQLVTVIWNIFLIFVPLAAYRILRSRWRRGGLAKVGGKIFGLILFFFWFLFFPNTAYIITDVRHLLNYCPLGSPNQVCPANAWMIMFFFTYSAIGWASFYYLLVMMSGLIKEIFSDFWRKAFIVFTIPLAALGVLLGLLNRFNSWDVFLYPGLFWRAVWFYFSRLDYFIDWAAFSLFLSLLYLAGRAIFKKIKD